MDLRAYFVRNVVGDFEAYRTFRRDGPSGSGIDTKLALYAALSQYHLLDHVVVAFRHDRALLPELSVGQLFARLCAKNPDFKLVCNCANALKHNRVDKHNPVIDGIGSIKDYPAVIKRVDAGGSYYVTDKPVFAELLDGRFMDLGAALLSGLQMWSEELIRLGVIPGMPKVALEPLVIHPAPTSRHSVSIKMTATVGEYFNERPLFFVHDEQAGHYRQAGADDPFKVETKVEMVVGPSIFVAVGGGEEGATATAETSPR